MPEGLLRSWMRRLGLGSDPAPAPAASPVFRALPGALVTEEARICSTLVEAGSERHGPLPELTGRGTVFGSPCATELVTGAPSALSRGVGLALGGQRCTVFVDLEDLPSCVGVLADAARRLAPIVVVALGEGRSLGIDTLIGAVADCGASIVVPGDPQDALDQALVARLLAETCQGPVVLVLPQAFAGPAAVLEDGDLRELLGAPWERVQTPAGAQRALWGAERRRLQGSFDLDHPMAQGLPAGPPLESLARAGRQALFGADRETALRGILDRVSQRTRRRIGVLVSSGEQAAGPVVVARGPAFHALRAVLGERRPLVGVTWLRPFPGAELAARLGEQPRVVVELSEGQRGQPGPLARELAGWLSSGALACSVQAHGLVALVPERVRQLDALLSGEALPPWVQLAGRHVHGPGDWPRRRALLDASHPAGIPSDPLPAAPSEGEPGLALLSGNAAPGVLLQELGAVVGDGHGSELELGGGHRFARLDRASPAGGLALLVLEGGPAGLPPELPEGLVEGALLVHDSELPAGWLPLLVRRRVRVLRLEGQRDQRLRRAMALLASSELEPLAAGEPAGPVLPGVLKRIRASRQAPDSLPHVYGALLQPWLAEGLGASPDALSASELLPGASAVLAPPAVPEQLPVLDASACSGCGACWTSCPEGAIGVLVCAPKALLDGASEVVGTRGRTADALRRAHAPIAKQLARSLGSEQAGSLGRGHLDAAWERVAGRLELSTQDRAEHDEVWSSTAEVLHHLAPVACAQHFHEPEAQSRGGGELLVWAVEPERCSGCGICVQECPEEALEAASLTEPGLTEAGARWRALSALPETSGATLDRLEERLGRAVAATSVRSLDGSFQPAPGGEVGSGERLGLRLVSALLERSAQPASAGLLQRLDKARKELRARLLERLSQPLGSVDQARLGAALDATTAARVPLHELVAGLGQEGRVLDVDPVELQRLTTVIGDLDLLGRRRAEGADGLGRGRFGVVVAGHALASRVAPWPWSPWWAPVQVCAAEQAGALARGLGQALRAQHLAELRALRRAGLVLANPSDLPEQLQALEALGWEELEPWERASCPPLLLVGERSALLGPGLAPVVDLLASGLSAVVLVLDGGASRSGLEPLSLGVVGARVLLASIAAPEQLAVGLERALDGGGGALVELHTPSSEAGLGAPGQARSALERRQRVLAGFLPGSGPLSERLDLAGNPEGSAPEADPEDLARWTTLRELAGLEGALVEELRRELTEQLEAAHQGALEGAEQRGQQLAAGLRAGLEAESLERLTERLVRLAGYSSGGP